MNDSHAYMEPHSEFFWDGGQGSYREAGGYARIATIIKDTRERNPGSVLALDNGDTIHGTYPAVKSRGEALIPILNEIKFDAMTGHWEFAYGPKRFEEISNRLHYPVLGINSYRKDNGELEFKPFLIVERGGLRVAVLGIISNIVDKTMPSSFSEGIHITMGEDELRNHIQHLRQEERVDLVIVLSHLGYPQELKLAKRVDGIDVLVSGHTHNRIYDAVLVNGAVAFQSGCHGSFIGRLDIKLGNSGIKDFNHQLISVDPSISQDPDVQKIVDRVMDPYRDELEETVGRTETGLNRNTVMESTMDNLLLKSIAEEAEADLAFSNGWRYGAPVPPGEMRMEDVWNIVPTNPPISKCRISGRELWEMMEENLERTFSPDPYQQMGGYVKRCLGVNIYFKIENPGGKRIHEFYVGGKRLDPAKEYDACFLTTQGIPAKYGDERENLDAGAVNALANYVKGRESVSSPLTGSIVPI